MNRHSDGCIDFAGCRFPPSEKELRTPPRKLRMMRGPKGYRRKELLREGRHFRKIVMVLPFRWYIVREFGVNDCLR